MSNPGDLSPILGRLTPWQDGPSGQPVGPRQSMRPQAPAPGEPGGPVAVSDSHRYANLRGDLVMAVSNAAGGTQILQSPDSPRNMLAIRNSSATANLYISFGNPASANSTFRLTPNQIMLLDTVVPQDEMFAFADAAGGQISVAFSSIGF